MSWRCCAVPCGTWSYLWTHQRHGTMVRFRLVQEIVSRHHGGNFVWTSDPEERDALWEARKVGSCCRVVPCVELCCNQCSHAAV